MKKLRGKKAGRLIRLGVSVGLLLIVGAICVNSVLTGGGSKDLKHAEETVTPIPEASLTPEVSPEITQPPVQKYRFYEKLANGEDVNILIVGDSIGYGSGASDKQHGWDYLLCKALSEKFGINAKSVNVSMGGNTSYAGYGRVMYLEESDFDLAVVCYGQNDAEADFELYYESIIRSIYQKNRECMIISVLESSQREYTAKMQSIRKIADYYGIQIADTIAAFNNSGFDYWKLTDDGVHPNDAGYKIYAETVFELICRNLNENNGYYSRLPEVPLDSRVKRFESFRFLHVRQFARKDDSTFTIQTGETEGILGIAYRIQPGNNICDIYIDGAPAVRRERKFDHNFSMGVVEIIAHDIRVENEIMLIFGSKAQADGFKGLAISNYIG